MADSHRIATGHVKLIERKRGPQFYAKFRPASGQQTTRLIGPAHLQRGRPPEGHFTPAMAEVELHRIMDEAVTATSTRVTRWARCPMTVARTAMALLVTMFFASAPAVAAEHTFTAKLDGASQVPKVDSKATGEATFTVSADGRKIAYRSECGGGDSVEVGGLTDARECL